MAGEGVMVDGIARTINGEALFFGSDGTCEECCGVCCVNGGSFVNPTEDFARVLLEGYIYGSDAVFTYTNTVHEERREPDGAGGFFTIVEDYTITATLRYTATVNAYGACDVKQSCLASGTDTIVVNGSATERQLDCSEFLVGDPGAVFGPNPDGSLGVQFSSWDRLPSTCAATASNVDFSGACPEPPFGTRLYGFYRRTAVNGFGYGSLDLAWDWKEGEFSSKGTQHAQYTVRVLADCGTPTGPIAPPPGPLPIQAPGGGYTCPTCGGPVVGGVCQQCGATWTGKCEGCGH